MSFEMKRLDLKKLGMKTMETSMIALTAWELEAERRREIAGAETVRLDADPERSIRSAASVAADREGRARAWIAGLLGGGSTGAPRGMTAPAGKPVRTGR